MRQLLFLVLVTAVVFMGCAKTESITGPNSPQSAAAGSISITLAGNEGLNKPLAAGLEIVASFTGGERQALADSYKVSYDVGQWFTIYDETGRVRYDLVVNGVGVPTTSIKDGRVHFTLLFNPLEVRFDNVSASTIYSWADITYVGKVSDTAIQYRGSFNNWTWTQMSQINDSTWIAPYREFIMVDPELNEITILGSDGPDDWRVRGIYVNGILLRRAQIERDSDKLITDLHIFFTRNINGDVINPGNEDLYEGSLGIGEVP